MSNCQLRRNRGLACSRVVSSPCHLSGPWISDASPSSRESKSRQSGRVLNQQTDIGRSKSSSSTQAQASLAWAFAPGCSATIHSRTTGRGTQSRLKHVAEIDAYDAATNDERQSREAAAADARVQAERTGCLPLAARSGWAFAYSRSELPGEHPADECAHRKSRRGRPTKAYEAPRGAPEQGALHNRISHYVPPHA